MAGTALSAPLRGAGLMQCQAPASDSQPSKHMQHIEWLKHLFAGSHGAVLALGDAKRPWLNLSGFWSWVAWRSAYLTRLGSINNRIYVMLNWLTTILFGRDMSRWACVPSLAMGRYLCSRRCVFAGLDRACPARFAVPPVLQVQASFKAPVHAQRLSCVCVCCV